ncbi:lysine-tRNA ligase [Schizosaccharomyces japonicus yFS275]|uniref:Lysyl-tRNA synthetase n=1 Tax=Schizosaccharomyces japonicus (strain yFS275 / FY16936) TaxID=402676 RepID=B6K6S1_SCHJY|nr:lysine-tRNA ligase [Schizosaccharomyces japonicus yFS275]EEB09225.1 lysine-tRNA ligase [Schizosaccharomyces japonicus yFS275]
MFFLFNYIKPLKQRDGLWRGASAFLLNPFSRFTRYKHSKSLQGAWPSKETRFQTFRDAKLQLYPRFNPSLKPSFSIKDIRKSYGSKFEKGEHSQHKVSICGRLSRLRVFGSGLVFADIVQNGDSIQLAFSKLRFPDVEQSDCMKAVHCLRRGDIVAVSGFVGTTKSGELTVFVDKKPTLLAPCLQDIPEKLNITKEYSKKQCLSYLVNTDTADHIRKRFQTISSLRKYFTEHDYLEVETPVLSRHFGGAAARPFKSTDIHGSPLSMRCAPEIWLKQLVISGFDRIFEVGKCFRNEGIDATHNPEFTSCEIYTAYSNLEELQEMTVDVLRFIFHQVNGSLQVPNSKLTLESFQSVSFLPALEKALGEELPVIDESDHCREALRHIFNKLQQALPQIQTTSKMLDELADQFLIPSFQGKPTFLMYHPEVLAPLAKSQSFILSSRQQRVSLRFELYINGIELCNAYEEENDPDEQRRKFLQQVEKKDAFPNEDIVLPDEDYVNAMQYGLPPTAGWGIGVDRLCMLVAGATRINQILPFGDLRYV